MRSIEKLIDKLNDPDNEDKQIVVRELVYKGISVLQPALNAIRNGPTPCNFILRGVLLQIKELQMIGEMKLLLDDENGYIRSIACSYLGGVNDAGVYDVLEKHLLDEDLLDCDRAEAAEALGEGKHFTALSVLKEQLKRHADEDDYFQYSPRIIISIAYAMALLGDSSALPYVLKFCKSKDFEYKLRANQKLRYFTGPGVFKQLQDALSGRNDQIKTSALDALYYLGTRNAAYEIWKLCKTRDPDIASYARYRLSQITGIEEDDLKIKGNFDDWLELKDISLNNESCFRSGYPINVPSLVKQITEGEPSRYLLEEIFVLTGNRFGHNPDVWYYVNLPDYKSEYDQWFKEYGSSYLPGKLYKLGCPQNIDLMNE